MAAHFDRIEADLTELAEEGISFLGAGDSAEPVLATWLNTCPKGSLQNQFRGEDHASRSHDPGQLLKHLAPITVEIEDAVDDSRIEGPLLSWYPFGVPKPKFHVRDRGRQC